MSVLTFRDGRIRSETLMFDLVTLCDQAGVTVQDARMTITPSQITAHVWRDVFVPRAGTAG